MSSSAQHTISGTMKFSSGIEVGSVPATIEGGTGALDVTNKGAGTIRLRSDGLPDFKKSDGSVENIGLDRMGFVVPIATLVANSANATKWRVPMKGKITAVQRAYNVAPASAGGTVLVSVKNAAGNEVLASGSENEEGLSNDPNTAAAHALTATTTNLNVDVGERITITITSNNADMTGGSGGFYIIKISAEDL